MKGEGFDLYLGDCLTSMRAMPDQSVHCCVTSPPYFGLRDYGTATWEGGDPDCDHGVRRWEGEKQTQGAQSGHSKKDDRLEKRECACGAVRIDEQIGLEATPDEFVAALVTVMREVKRVLRDDGTLWLNLGDSYNNFRSQMGPGQAVHGRDKLNGKPEVLSKKRGVQGLKEKDLIGIPWRVAFALQADGWTLRQDIIWQKPNPMPESVTDRCTKSHEYVFLLSKSPRYYFDHVAIKEPAVKGAAGSEFHTGKTGEHQLGRASTKPRESAKRGSFNGKTEAMASTGQNAFRAVVETRNRRSVWSIATRPYKGAHFATFPPALIEPCILAGCPVGGTVLDPFGGSGTTAGVAIAHGREAVICELNPEYAELMPARIASILESYGKKPKAKRQAKAVPAAQGGLFDGAHC